MMSEWSSVSIQELAIKVTIGPFGSSLKTDAYTPSGVPVIRGTNLCGGRSFIGDWVYVSDSTADRLPAAVVSAGDLVFPHRGSIGEVGIVPNDYPRYLMSTSLMRASLDEDVCDPRYYFYFFKSQIGRSELLKNASQVGTPGIGQPLSTLKAIRVPFPPRCEQERIANVLSALNDRIDHNRTLAANLEAIARRLFKSWFVDFDPVRAKAVGEKPPGLADDLAVLFPDRFVDSELGDVPDGWKVGKISDFSTNVRVGCTPSQFSSEDFYVGLEHFDRRCLTLWKGGSGDDATSNKTRFSKGDLLFGKLRPYFHKVAIAPTDGICSTDILVIRCTDIAYRQFMYLSLFQDDVIQFVSDASGGTRMPRTNWETLERYDCVVPPQPVACAFGEIVAPMIETMMQCVSENDALTKIRDLLLPRLISGKLHVADAESFIEEVIE